MGAERLIVERACMCEDLLYGRTFWTGEVIEDYVFHAS